MTNQRLVMIVTLSILAAILLLGGTCFVFREPLVRMTTKSALRTFYTSVAADSTISIDTASFGNLLRAFSERIDSLSLEDPKFLGFMQTMQQVYTDRTITAEDVDSSARSIIAIYPDLAPLWKRSDAQQAVDSAAVPLTDSLMIDSLSMDSLR